MAGPPRAAGAARQGATRGAIAAVAGALLAVAAVTAWTPRLLLSVLGPPPVPSVLAGASLVAAAIAGALVGRRVVRAPGPTAGRIARAVLWTAVGYLCAVTASVAALNLAVYGPAALATPFGLVAYGLSVALLLAPWAALPILWTAAAVELWTRGLADVPPPAPRASADPPPLRAS